MSDVITFLTERLNDDLRQIAQGLCIHCGLATEALNSPFGVTGYTHAGGWEGVRCPNRMTGATRVQEADLKLRAIFAKQSIVQSLEFILASGRAQSGEIDLATRSLSGLAIEWSTHPDYNKEWNV